MNDKFLFEKLEEITTKKNIETECKLKEERRYFCLHQNKFNDMNNVICCDCGQMLTSKLTYEQDVRYYGATDSKFHVDPTRTNMRKPQIKGIFKEISKFGFNNHIMTDATILYNEITGVHSDNKKIFRSSKRKGIIFACVYVAHNRLSKISCEHLMDIFEISQSIALSGLKYLNTTIKPSLLNEYQNELHQEDESSSKDSVINLIEELMLKFQASDIQIDEIKDLYEIIKKKSSLLNRSRPISVASGLVKYYILKKNPNYSNDSLKKKIKLSELTLSRIMKEIDQTVSS